MFTDYIKPEITYTYADSDVDHTNKTLTVFAVCVAVPTEMAFSLFSDSVASIPSIYTLILAFVKLLVTSPTGTINYTKGTINPKYRTEWVKEENGVTIDKTNKY